MLQILRHLKAALLLLNLKGFYLVSNVIAYKVVVLFLWLTVPPLIQWSHVVLSLGLPNCFAEIFLRLLRKNIFTVAIARGAHYLGLLVVLIEGPLGSIHETASEVSRFPSSHLFLHQGLCFLLHHPALFHH